MRTLRFWPQPWWRRILATCLLALIFVAALLTPGSPLKIPQPPNPVPRVEFPPLQTRWWVEGAATALADRSLLEKVQVQATNQPTRALVIDFVHEDNSRVRPQHCTEVKSWREAVATIRQHVSTIPAGSKLAETWTVCFDGDPGLLEPGVLLCTMTLTPRKGVTILQSLYLPEVTVDVLNVLALLTPVAPPLQGVAADSSECLQLLGREYTSQREFFALAARYLQEQGKLEFVACSAACGTLGDNLGRSLACIVPAVEVLLYDARVAWSDRGDIRYIGDDSGAILEMRSPKSAPKRRQVAIPIAYHLPREWGTVQAPSVLAPSGDPPVQGEK